MRLTAGSCPKGPWGKGPWRVTFLLLAAGARLATAADEVPGVAPKVPVILSGAMLHPVHGPAIENGTLVFKDGKIVTVQSGALSTPLPDALTIDVSGQHVYPGLLDADSAIGLVEIQAVRATVDVQEVGSLNPNAQAVVAFNPDSELIPVARSDGILLALSVPRGPFLCGLSALMQMDGWNAQDMALRRIVGLHVTWPLSPYRFATERDPKVRAEIKSREVQLNRFREMLEQARALEPLPADERAADANLRLEAIARVVRREIPLIVRADELMQIQECVALAEQFRLRLIISGGYDAPLCADLLKRHQVPVIVTGTHRLPLRVDSRYDEPFTVPARLHQAGVSFCLAGYDRFSASGLRNLPQHAGTAVAFGLPREAAVRAMTLSAAEILGVDERVGSLDVGKDATLIVTSGDILEIPSQVTRAFIRGIPVDLDNRQKRLWQKYRERHRRLATEGPQVADPG